MKGRLLALVLCMGVGSTWATPDPSGCEFTRHTQRIHIMVGSDPLACDPDNPSTPRTNPAVVIGEEGVVVIDPGSSVQVGRHVLRQLQRLTDKPVVALINTHIHGLYWLGNQAFVERFPGIPIYAHEKMIERIDAGEGQQWVETITANIPGEKTRFVVPNRALRGGEQRQIAGMTVRFHHPGHAHTDHDLMVEVAEEKALFLGGVVVEPEVPSQGVPHDAHFAGQIEATRQAIDLGLSVYVPGQGHPGGIELPRRGLAFLQALYSGVERYYLQDLSDFEITERLKQELSDYQESHDLTHLGGVVSQMYLQVESASF